jgi:hypothetical protein
MLLRSEGRGDESNRSIKVIVRRANSCNLTEAWRRPAVLADREIADLRRQCESLIFISLKYSTFIKVAAARAQILGGAVQAGRWACAGWHTA